MDSHDLILSHGDDNIICGKSGNYILYLSKYIIKDTKVGIQINDIIIDESITNTSTEPTVIYITIPLKKGDIITLVDVYTDIRLDINGINLYIF